jgi:excisionase family DNA binding protein
MTKTEIVGLLDVALAIAKQQGDLLSQLKTAVMAMDDAKAITSQTSIANRATAGTKSENVGRCLYTIKEAGQLLALSHHTIRKMCERKEIVSVKLGSAVRIDRVEIEPIHPPLSDKLGIRTQERLLARQRTAILALMFPWAVEPDRVAIQNRSASNRI